MTILRQHLAEFQVANSQCYCCSVDHRLPETGEKVACDREVIQACIACARERFELLAAEAVPRSPGSAAWRTSTTLFKQSWAAER